MKIINHIKETYNYWQKYRNTIKELSAMSDHDLRDIGITRGMIEEIAREAIKSEISQK